MKHQLLDNKNGVSLYFFIYKFQDKSFEIVSKTME